MKEGWMNFDFMSNTTRICYCIHWFMLCNTLVCINLVACGYIQLQFILGHEPSLPGREYVLDRKPPPPTLGKYTCT